MNHILIVDDEAEIRESLSEILKEDGYAVTSTASAAEAMVLLRDASYDVLLLDIWLPDRDGLEVLTEIRSLETDSLPEVIIISGHGTIETAVRATKLGAFDFPGKAAFHRSHPDPAQKMPSRHAGYAVRTRSSNASCWSTYRSPGKVCPLRRCASRLS